jgi:hypothetical protein
MVAGRTVAMGGKGFRRQGKVVWPGHTEIPQRQIERVGRNDPCPCGGGKKYKDCHADEGETYLTRLAQEAERKRRIEFLESREGKRLPWYRRLLLRLS